MDADEIEELRAEFSKVDRKSKVQLKRWFYEYPELTTPEQAIVMQRTCIRVNRIRKALGIRRKLIMELDDRIVYLNPIQQSTRKPTKKAPKVGTDLWMLDQYKSGESLISISRALGVSLKIVRSALKRYGVYEKKEFINPLRTREWVTEHYINQTLTIDQCSELANIDPSTFTEWLIYFDLSPRDLFEHNEILGQKIIKSANIPSGSEIMPVKI